MQAFNVPTREEVSEKNQQIFDQLEKKLGFVPNLFATYAYSENALANYLTFQNGKTSLSNKEKEIVNLIVSQVNDCRYCQSVHTAVGKMNGFTDEQIIEIRTGHAPFNEKYDALVKLAKSITVNRGKADEAALTQFFAAGYTKENLTDTIVLVGEKTISNYVHRTTEVPIDFPIAPVLELRLTANGKRGTAVSRFPSFVSRVPFFYKF